MFILSNFCWGTAEVSHQVVQAALQFSILSWSLVINTGKGKGISFHPTSREEARRRKRHKYRWCAPIRWGASSTQNRWETLPMPWQGRLPYSHTWRSVAAMTRTGILKERQIQLAGGSRLSMVSASPERVPLCCLGARQAGGGRVPVRMRACSHRDIFCCASAHCSMNVAVAVLIPPFCLILSKKDKKWKCLPSLALRGPCL